MQNKITGIQIREADQIIFVLDNIPGSLAKVSQVLRDNDINIEGMSLSDSADWSIKMYMVVDNAEAARKALSPLVKSISAQKIISFQVFDDRPGFIAIVAKKLGDAFINIDQIYHASAGRASAAVIHIRVDPKNYDRALAIAKDLASE